MAIVTPMINFSSIFHWHALRTPDDLAIQFEGNKITYLELDRSISRFASSIRAHGGKEGDLVAILMYNQPEFLITAFGANRAGLVFLPLNYRLAPEELAYILGESGAKFLVTEDSFRDQIDLIRDRLPRLTDYVLIKGHSDKIWHSFATFLGNDDSQFKDYDAKPEELHRLMYTSGTTANPKGVMISYSSMWWKTFAHFIELESRKADIALVAGPLYHVGAFDLASAHVLLAGGSLVIHRKFDAKACLEAIAENKITLTWLAPSMINALLHRGDVSSYDLTSLRLLIDGGERMPEPLISKLFSIFPNVRYADAYGLTETVSGDTFVPQRHMRQKLGSVGLPTLFVDLKIVDENDKTVPSGFDGEIVIKGPKVFSGYWKNDFATRRALKGEWFHTGDVGHLDNDGFLYITDRKKDMIKSGGENISSLEIERVLYMHPDIAEVAALGMKDQKWGEVPVAFIVVKEDRNLGEDQLINFCHGKIAKFKIPKKFIFQREPLPRNPSGKVIKRLLRERINRQEISK